jgi:hypothetical protein
MVSILTIYVQYQRPYSSYFSAATLEASLASVGAVATNSDCGVILLVARTFANCMDANKAELRAPKEGIHFAAPGVTEQLILRMIVQLLYIL